MNCEEISSLVSRLERAGVCELTYREASETLTVRLSLAPGEPPTVGNREAAEPAASPRVPNPKEIVANATGTFSRDHPLAAGSAPSEVKKGDHVGYLAIESVLSAVPAPADGRTGRQITEDGKTVGYGDAVLEFLDA